MLCIQLKFPNQPGNYWYQLLKNIDFTGCRFAILKDDILRYDADGTCLLYTSDAADEL